MRKMRSCIDEKLYRTLHTIVHNHTLPVAEARIGMRENFRCSASSTRVQSQLSTLSQIMKTVDPSIRTSLVVRGSESLYHPSMHVIRRMIETVLLWPSLNSDSVSKAQHGCIDCLALMICVELQAEEDSIPKRTSVVRKKGNSVVSYVINQYFNDKESTSTPELGDESVVAVPLSFRVCMGDVLISACQKISESCKKQFAEQVLPSVLHSVKVSPKHYPSHCQSAIMTTSNQSSSHGQSNNTSHANQVVVVVVPFPAQGHLNQLLHLSRLILSHNIPVHYVGTATHNLQAKVRVQGWDPNSISNIHFHDLKVPPFASPPPNPNGETKFPSHLIPSFEAAYSHLRQPVAALLLSLSLKARKIIVIYDSLMASVVQDVTCIVNAENYIFHSISAFTAFSFFIDLGISSLETSIIPELPSMEGCFTTEMRDLINAQVEFLEFNDGSIFNTTRAIEGPYLELMEQVSGGKKSWALGPFNPLTIEEKNSKERHFTLKWLDEQEPKSVIYISFGTTTALTGEQIKEIATGLEQSKQKFIWVIRDADKGNIFDDDEVRRHELPDRFEERLEGIGLVVRDWAPQLEILSHTSTGGFMSHCGWNSCIESMTMGVPIAAWPMHSDQPRNSVLLTQVLKVGLVVKDWAQRNELVTASDVENAVRRLMEKEEGGGMRQRAMNLKDAIQRSMDEGGISRVEMDSFIGHITS
ncbi:hypothetical protein RIF29_19988 [Crotalaria pallida]|uniref:Glycosyltransferase N-terminal domain-containing protein n=1 Tax=Crotalaria pallida TaxID=3830 RepID=A0AAN9F261_CROPI